MVEKHKSTNGLPLTPWERFRSLLFGRAKDIYDPALGHKISLVAFMAWIGLGADGLSSSAYGPEEAFRALGGHSYLAIFLILATAGTVFIISYAYSRIIEHFPIGGGGYVVATKLLGKNAGVVSGCALLVDYILTITVSIAGGGDALFSLLPYSYQSYKLWVEFAAIVFLLVMNLRGVKESVAAIVPIFTIFIVSHVILIFGGILSHAGSFPVIFGEVRSGIQTGVDQIGVWGLFLVLLRAYSLGGGTYTGIEAVSNGVGILRDPKVETGKRTMLYMATSLAVTAGGLLLCYMLFHVSHVPGRTLNAVLADNFAGRIHLGPVPLGAWFVKVTIFSEAMLLLVAAQTGFIDGPRVMANMAIDSWIPRRYATLSDRLTMQDGIFSLGVAALLLLVYSKGHIGILVVMYSINVFLTFSLSELGMVGFWYRSRKTEPTWKRDILIHATGLVLCFSILCVMIMEKFQHGAWLTVVITLTCIAHCFLIKRHYFSVAKRVKEIDTVFENVPASEAKTTVEPFDPKAPTAVILVGGYSGLGLHIFLNIFRLFPHSFENVIFASVGVVNSEFFKSGSHVEEISDRTHETLMRYVDFSGRMGIPARSEFRVGTDVVFTAAEMCIEISKQLSHSIFFAGELVFEQPQWYHKWLHNETAYAILRRIRFSGLPMVILPIRISMQKKAAKG
ncbi:MAG: APC family permease [Candidatus Omnitrophica bacterium]|nr:APC family permease [Candidatus Omnitrophota bacterium]